MTSFRTGSRLMSTCAFPLVLLAAWEIAVRYEVFPPSQAAAPSAILARLVRLLATGPLVSHGAYSVGRICAGVAIGTVAGMFTGLVLGSSGRADALLSPTLRLLAGVPVVIWIPFWVMCFGTDEAFKIAMAAISTFFLVHLYTFHAIRSVERTYMELADMYEKSTWDRWRHVFLPSATLAILTATRTSLAFGWVVIFFVEYASARQGSEGLGWFIADARAIGRIEDEFAGLTFLAVIAYLTDQILALLQRRLVSWADTVERTAVGS